VDSSTSLDSVIPDLGMLGLADPHARAITPRPPTIGQLAARIHDLAARPGDWWHLVRFDPAVLVRIPLDETAGVGIWLTTWPPGGRTDLHDHSGAEVMALMGGELVEINIGPGGVTERALRAGRLRVHGGGHTHELHNPGRAYALTLCAHLTAGRTAEVVSGS